mmetsp:Transcript_127500/g.354957  ORF Transcript_127500/g.354957 Transcript_127500/m.354957 type:complete len:298 (-) Transcript_127500:1558-2451(-)
MSSGAPRLVRRRSTIESRTSKRPSLALRAEASPQIFSARTSELAVITCMSRNTSLSWPTTATLDVKVGPLPSASCMGNVFCPLISTTMFSKCRVSSAWSSAQFAVMSPRSSARAAEISPRSPALAASSREVNSPRSSPPKLRMRPSNSVASRPSAAERSERRAPASAWRFSLPPEVASSMTRSEPAPLLTVSFNSDRIVPLLQASSSSAALSEAKALVRSCALSTAASPTSAEFTLIARSASAARSFSTSAMRSLRSAFSSSLRSLCFIECLSVSFLRASRSVSRALTMFPSRISNS